VLDDVTLTLPARGLFGRCGPNGAGKSTLLGIIGGSVPPSRGRVLLDGADVTRLPPQQRFGLGVSRTFQAVHLISLSSGWQTNGYPASELASWGFPGFYDVFYEDQLASVQQLIVPRHYTRVALLEDNCGSVCPANQGTVQELAAQFGFKLVSTQIDQVGATDVTPQVLAMLAAKPQIILFGLVPGTDSITAIRAILAQNANIPISECSACELPSFVAAAGGASAMHNIYILGSMQSWLNAASKGTSAQARQTATGLKEYFTGMKAAGYTSENQLDNSQEGWDAGLEINWAVTSAGTLDETAVIGPDGGVTLYDATKTK
jgi:energy-coupling factor transporter ATP-binding protein EcfA2